MKEIDLGADAGEWYAALNSVLGLHVPDTTGPAADKDFCGACGHAYPCATVRAIADEVFFDLEENEDSRGS
jgi:hypothetical protein